MLENILAVRYLCSTPNLKLYRELYVLCQIFRGKNEVHVLPTNRWIIIHFLENVGKCLFAYLFIK